MKLTYSFEYVDMGDEIIAVPVGPSAEQVQGVLRLNKEAEEIVRFLSDDISEQEIIDKLCHKYTTDKHTIALHVHTVISTLKESGMIKE